MIAWIEGTLRDKEPLRVVIDVNGVGYELHVPLSTSAALPDVGKTVALHAHTIVREDALLLYGFATTYERDVFEMLLRANRVGPKLAQTMLSGMPPERLVGALRDGEVAAMKGIPGVGAKTAERMVVELRERATALGSPATGGEPESMMESESDLREQLLSALVNLGYPRSRAERVVETAVAEAGEEAGIESLIRIALRSLAR
ncbi:MAG: Holliday junction branch migration protein RuvA [Myxococcota bacterium]|nr:Holliday junction branch migration protein RuvA [Myxococcota bacterium]